MAELPACSSDISTSAGADMAVHALLTEHALEMVDIVAAGAFEGESFDLVIADEVDIGAEFFDDGCEFDGMLWAIVDAAEEDVFEGDLAPGFLEPVRTGIDELIDRGELSPWNKLATQRVVGRVDREGEGDGEIEFL